MAPDSSLLSLADTVEAVWFLGSRVPGCPSKQEGQHPEHEAWLTDGNHLTVELFCLPDPGHPCLTAHGRTVPNWLVLTLCLFPEASQGGNALWMVAPVRTQSTGLLPHLLSFFHRVAACAPETLF